MFNSVINTTADINTEDTTTPYNKHKVYSQPTTQHRMSINLDIIKSMFHNYALVNQYTKQVAPSNAASYNPLRMVYGDVSDPNSPAHPEQRFQTLSEDLVGEYRSKYGAGIDSLMGQNRSMTVNNVAQRNNISNDIAGQKLNETAPLEPIFTDTDAKTDTAQEMSREAFVRNHPINVPVLERVSYGVPVKEQFGGQVKEGYSVKHKTSHFVEVLVMILFVIGVFVLINIYLTQQRLEIMLKYYTDSGVRHRD